VRRVVIIGGGISGLSAGYHLAKHGIPSTLIERRPRLGGVIHTEQIQGCVVEAGPDSFLSAKPWAMDLIRELGLQEQVISSNDHLRATYIRKAGRLLPMPDGLMLMVPTRILPMAATRLLSWSAKIRIALECFRRPTAPPAGDRSIAEFIREHYGRQVVDYLAEPLLAGVYGGDPEQLSAASVLPLFVELERKYGSLSRGILASRRRRPRGAPAPPLFQTLKDGLGALIQRLAEAASSHLTVLHEEALQVRRRPSGFEILLAGGAIQAENLILACQADEAGRLLESVDPELAAALASIPYNSSVTVSLGYRRDSFDGFQHGFGFLIPRCERKRLIACTFVGTKFPFRTPQDMVMLRCFLGGTAEPALQDPDETVVADVRAELREILGLTAQPVFARVHRWPRSMAQYTVGHRARIEFIERRRAAIPGLELAGNAYTGIGVPDCARMGKQAAENILARLSAS
jgi:oxygen-dependent protoporphyrinogen oxidase